jgi:predicted RNase H-like HicB family nuclease
MGSATDIQWYTTRYAGIRWRMKFPTVIDRDEDGMWVVECPAIPGCVSQGRTREEAMENIKEAIALCLEVRAERGMPLTFETSQVEVAV